ncbi:MAG: tyrosine-type recombinase/integrase [Alphaproteobacteria bacterium]
MASMEERIDKNGNKTYRVKVRLKGTPTQTATFPNKTKAKDWVRRTELEIKDGRYNPTLKSRKHTLRDLIARYKKIVLPTKLSVSKDFINQLNYWDEKLGDCLLINLTSDKIIDARSELSQKITNRGRIISNATINRYLVPLSSAINTAIREWSWLEINPMSKIKKLKEDAGRTNYLSKEEKERLLVACKENSNYCLYPVVVLALATGGRKMEVLGLKLTDINFKTGLMTFHKTKNAEKRSMTLPKFAMSVLNFYRKRLDKDELFLFPSNNGLKPMDIRRPWKNALKKAEIEDFRFHDLRHTTASYLVMGGASLVEVAEILGHKTLQMVQRYAHLSEGHKKKVIEDYSKKMFGE